jgi:hypothetical protein
MKGEHMPKDEKMPNPATSSPVGIDHQPEPQVATTKVTMLDLLRRIEQLELKVRALDDRTARQNRGYNMTARK